MTGRGRVVGYRQIFQEYIAVNLARQREETFGNRQIYPAVRLLYSCKAEDSAGLASALERPIVMRRRGFLPFSFSCREKQEREEGKDIAKKKKGDRKMSAKLYQLATGQLLSMEKAIDDNDRQAFMDALNSTYVPNLTAGNEELGDFYIAVFRKALRRFVKD